MIERTPHEFAHHLRLRFHPESTVIRYTNVIKRFRNDYDNTIEGANQMIFDHCNETRSYYVYFALLKFLRFENFTEDELKKNVNPIKIRPPQKLHKKHPRADLEKIIKHIENKKFKLLAMIQKDCGARAGDILTLRPNMIDFEPDGMARVMLLTKGRKTRMIYLNLKAAVALKMYLLENNIEPSQYIFLSQSGGIRNLWSVYASYDQNLRQAARSIGIEDFSTHSFRRNMAYDLWLINKDLLACAQFMGMTVQTFERYVRSIAGQMDIKGHTKALRGEEEDLFENQ